MMLTKRGERTNIEKTDKDQGARLAVEDGNN